MFGLAREEWRTATDVLDASRKLGIADKVTRDHLTSLGAIGIVEREDWKFGGYSYRIKQEGGPVAPVSIVERYLSIVTLSSVEDPDFISEGLDRLGEIASDPKSVTELLVRSQGSYGTKGGHGGRKPTA